MPKMSMTMEVGELIVFLVKVGDSVKAGDALFEVMTDKIDMEVESPTDGVVEEIIGSVGDEIAIGKTVIVLGTEKEVMSFNLEINESLPVVQDQEIPPVISAPVISAPVISAPVISAPVISAPVISAPVISAPVILSEERSGAVKAVPKARVSAKERGIDITQIIATGPFNTITLADVNAAKVSPEHQARRSANRKLVASAVAKTSQIPKVTYSRVIYLEEKDENEMRIKVIAAWAKILRAHQIFNISSIDESPNAYVGLALLMESKYGAATPVFRDPDLLTLAQLSSHVDNTRAAARDGRVPLAMLSGATTTIFDLSDSSISIATPLLFPAQITSITIGSLINGEKIISLTIDLRYCDAFEGSKLLDSLISELA